MANSGEWEALAEIYLDNGSSAGGATKSSLDHIYCLCSRVFIKNYYDIYASTLEKDEEQSEVEEVAIVEQIDSTVNIPERDTHVHFSVVSGAELLSNDNAWPEDVLVDATGATPDYCKAQEVEQEGEEEEEDEVNNHKAKPHENDTENEANSCYCSASHTDNNYSTDEHENHHVGNTSGRQQVFNSMARPQQRVIVETKELAVNAIVAAKRDCDQHLHSSDSGADISENHLLDKMKWPADHKTSLEEEQEEEENSNKKNTKKEMENSSDGNAELNPEVISEFLSPLRVSHERNNSLPNVLCPEELATEWESYWSRNGEQLIWASWIEKYSDYIDPAFKDGLRVGGSLSQDPFPGCSTADTLNEANVFTFEEEQIQGLSAAEEPQIVVSRGEGDSLKGDQRLLEEDQEVLWASVRGLGNRLSVELGVPSPRCESVNSSIPCTIGGATDSMTNVTRMTISSCEFCSSKVTSESSQDNNSIGTTTSESEEEEGEDNAEDPLENLQEKQENEETSLITQSSDFYGTMDSDGATLGKLDPAATDETSEDVDQHWQVLWERHFQDQYTRHYNEFMDEQQQSMDDRVKGISGSFKSESIHDLKANHDCHSRRPRSVKRRSQKSANECLPTLVANLQIRAQERETRQEGDSAPVDGEDGQGEEGNGQENATAEESVQRGNESNLMASMGLPQAFGSTKQTQQRHSRDEDEDEDEDGLRRRAVVLKRAHESDNEEPPRDRIKDAFHLMGFAFEPQSTAEGLPSVVTNGEVVYRKKHIRLHNRALKMRIQTRPKLHLRFDEEGNAIEEDTDLEGKEGGAVVAVPVGDDVTGDPVLMHSSSDEDFDAAQLNRNCAIGGVSAGVIANKVTASVPLTQAQETKHDLSDEEQQQQVKQQQKKKRKRKGKTAALPPPEIANDKALKKYWIKRFSLFQLFDLGIRMDRESWFSVTPEKVAAHISERCRCDLIVDGFCGVGGNAIQFAQTCTKVIAIDIDPKKIEMARFNAGIYGVADRIEFIVGDFFQLAKGLTADVVFLSPPWGGPEYMKVDTYDLETQLQPAAGSVLMEAARRISSNVAIFVPRNSNTQQLTKLAGPGGSVEIEQSFLDRKLIALTAYYGELINE